MQPSHRQSRLTILPGLVCRVGAWGDQEDELQARQQEALGGSLSLSWAALVLDPLSWGHKANPTGCRASQNCGSQPQVQVQLNNSQALSLSELQPLVKLRKY